MDIRQTPVGLSGDRPSPADRLRCPCALPDGTYQPGSDRSSRMRWPEAEHPLGSLVSRGWLRAHDEFGRDRFASHPSMHQESQFQVTRVTMQANLAGLSGFSVPSSGSGSLSWTGPSYGHGYMSSLENPTFTTGWDQASRVRAAAVDCSPWCSWAGARARVSVTRRSQEGHV
jgi:hypothetical protein